VARNGFGDPLNAYAHAMVLFHDHIYVGTTRANLCLARNQATPGVRCWPVKCPEKDLHELDMRAQIWRYDTKADRLEQVHVAPRVVGRWGIPAPREIGFRGMTVFQGESDAAPALYVATWGSRRAWGPMILRSADGEEFVPVTRPGEGPAMTFRSLLPFRGRLYTAAVGVLDEGVNKGIPVVLESEDPGKGEWRLVSPLGFGNPDNISVFELAVFNDCVYAGTGNAATGYEIWKTRAEGDPPYHWTKVVERGAYRGPLNEGVISMFEFRGALYAGSGIHGGGFDVVNNIGPAAAELIRIHPDDSWDLVVGEPRETPRGLLGPLSGHGPGFDNFYNAYFWRMAELDGWLYLGTYDWACWLPYFNQRLNPLPGQRLAEWVGAENIVRLEGGFDLFRTRDGVTWVPVTTSGFGNPYNIGARTMVTSKTGLFVGTANPFGPEVAIRAPWGWTYVPNPWGGCELWHGARPEAMGVSLPAGEGAR
jgi:hypothetical protein